MKNSILITKYILEILKDNERLREFINPDNIYPIDAKEGTKFPFAVINRTGIVANYSKDGGYSDQVDVSISVVDQKYINSANIANEVRRALEGKSFSDNDTQLHKIRLTNVYESFYNNAYIQQLNFRIDVL